MEIHLRTAVHEGLFYRTVAPFVGAWIEIEPSLAYTAVIIVAPFVGAWIEISRFPGPRNHRRVAPFVGAWIEIAMISASDRSMWSLPF